MKAKAAKIQLEAVKRNFEALVAAASREWNTLMDCASTRDVEQAAVEVVALLEVATKEAIAKRSLRIVNEVLHSISSLSDTADVPPEAQPSAVATSVDGHPAISDLSESSKALKSFKAQLTKKPNHFQPPKTSALLSNTISILAALPLSPGSPPPALASPTPQRNISLSLVHRTEEDVALAKRMEEFALVTPAQFGVRAELTTGSGPVPFLAAAAHMRTISGSKSGREKLMSVLRAIQAVYSEIESLPDRKGPVNGDDLADILVWVVMKAAPRALASDLSLLTDGSTVPQDLIYGEAGYYLSTLQLAATYIGELTWGTLWEDGGRVYSSNSVYALERVRTRNWISSSKVSLKMSRAMVKLHGYRPVLVEQRLWKAGALRAVLVEPAASWTNITSAPPTPTPTSPDGSPLDGTGDGQPSGWLGTIGSYVWSRGQTESSDESSSTNPAREQEPDPDVAMACLLEIDERASAADRLDLQSAFVAPRGLDTRCVRTGHGNIIAVLADPNAIRVPVPGGDWEEMKSSMLAVALARKVFGFAEIGYPGSYEERDEAARRSAEQVWQVVYAEPLSSTALLANPWGALCRALYDVCAVLYVLGRTPVAPTRCEDAADVDMVEAWTGRTVTSLLTCLSDQPLRSEQWTGLCSCLNAVVKLLGAGKPYFDGVDPGWTAVATRVPEWTQSVVAPFQRRVGLFADGKIGKEVLECLGLTEPSFEV